MTQEQENQWLYAKALEIAALIKGPCPKNFENTNASLAWYEPLVSAIARRIRNHANNGYKLSPFLPSRPA
jgi:hypothetical protein